MLELNSELGNNGDSTEGYGIKCILTNKSFSTLQIFHRLKQKCPPFG